MNKLVIANKWWLLGAAWVYTFTFVFNHYWSKSASYDTITQHFSTRIQDRLQQFDTVSKDTSILQQLLHFEPNTAIAKQADTYYYLYQDSPDGMQLQYWSHAGVVPLATDIPYRDTVKTVEYGNGFYVMATHKLQGSLLTAVQLILVRQEYFVQTTNLQTAFPGYADLEKHINITTTSTTPFVVTDNHQRPLFYLLPIANRPNEIFNWASLIVQITATLMLLIFIYRIGVGLVRQQQLIRAFTWIVATTLLIRLCIGALNFPINISNTILFQPLDHPFVFFHSLGGLLLNLLLLVWMLFFILHTRYSWLPLLESSTLQKKKAIVIFSGIALLPFSFFLCQLIIHLVAQPRISFDVANFFSLGWDTAGAVICLYFICVLHYRVLHLFNEVADKLWPQKIQFKLLLATIVGLSISSILLYRLQGQIFIWTLVWLLITLLLEDKLPHLFFYGMERSVRFVFWLIWYGIAGTLLVQSQQHQKELDYKLYLAQARARHENTDVNTWINQGLLSKAVKDLEKAPLPVEDSAYNSHTREGIAVAFNKMMIGYTINIYLFDSTGKSLYNRDSTTYETLNTIVEQQGQTTDVPDVYLYESAFDQFRYLIRKPLQQDSLNGGSLFITITPASFSTQALVAELFKPLQTGMQNSALYDYAIYRHGILLSSTHKFPFSTVLSPRFKLQSEYEARMMNGREVLWYNAGSNQLIAIVKSGGIFFEAITIFAYVFSCFVLLFLLEQLLAQLLSDPYPIRLFRLGTPLSIRSKIRRTVILVSVLSFVLIGIATVYFFIHRYRQNNDSRLSQLVTTVEKDLKSLTDVRVLFQQPYTTGDPANSGNANSVTITGLAQLLGTDIDLFDLKGSLTATSQPIAYDRGIISTKMNPVAFYQMVYNHQIQFLQTETIGQLTYQGVYLPVRTTEGVTLGFINIPYFASQVELNQEISNFLVTLVNLIAFISIIAGIIAFFITNSITTSFYLIGEKMKVVSLGKTNEPIAWNRNDEIGVLVLQYNKMLEQLDESARKLASNEREYAWREMAKQVAHEIKNPLTPMKLNLQYLQRQLENDAPNVKQMAAKTAMMLVTQIDHLSQIASDFSQLARINIARLEKFDLQEVLNEVVMLYQMDSHLKITWAKTLSYSIVEADRTQINRLFTNLIKNAGEAVTGQALITIDEQQEGETVTISIADNGPGIPQEMQSKLFVPNFTTKTSGTGLGLAICKDIVERAGGSIWFQSADGGPTTFFVQLPLAKN